MSDGKVLVLRTCDADRKSHGGFQWPESGPVEAPDWNPVAECGRGLHGLLWGEGDGALVSWDSDAAWLVVEVDAASIVDLVGKVKFPRGIVVHCGTRESAIAYLMEHEGSGRAIVGGTATAGEAGTATAGVRGIVLLRWWDSPAKRWRMTIGYTGEDGIEAGARYRSDAAGRLVKVQP